MALVPLAQIRGSVVTLGTSAGVAAKPDPSRVALVFSNLGTTAVEMSIQGQAADATVIVLPASLNPVKLHVSDVGQLVTQGFSAKVSTGTGSLGVTEVVLLE